MNRRKFMQAMLAGVATVAIAAKMAPKFPVFEQTSTFPTGWIVSDEEIDDGLYGDIGERYAKALAKSMMETNARFVRYRDMA